MKCAKIARYLSPYLDGELGETERREVKSHLARCERCAGELAEGRRLRLLLGRTERFTAPPGFRAGVMARIHDRPAPWFSWRLLPAGLARACVAAAVIGAGVMSGSVLVSGVAAPHRGQLLDSMALETFEALPADSLGGVYLALTEERG